MSARTDPDGKLRAWLDLMPDEAPDRAIAAVLDAIDATPQARRSRWWTSWRASMNRSFAALVAAVVVVVIGATLVLRTTGQAVVGSSAAPSMPASAGPSPASLLPVPKALLGAWMGSHRAIVSDGAGVAVRFGGDKVTIAQSNSMDSPVADGDAGLGLDHRLQLRLTVGECTSASFGLYSWDLSPTGRVLTVTRGNDPCGDRGDAVAGTYWRMACRDAGTGCLGDLDAGTYSSQYITPLAVPAAEWRPKFGGVTYTVPDGWANWSDWPGSFGLTTSSEFGRTTAASVAPDDSLDVLTAAAAESQTTPCSNKPNAAAAVNAAAIASSLRADAGLMVGPPTSVTIDGHRGVSVDLSADAAKIRPCNGAPIVEYLVAGGEGQGIASGERERLILIDVGPANVVAIRIHVHDAATFDGFAAKAMPIVQTFRFQ